MGAQDRRVLPTGSPRRVCTRLGRYQEALSLLIDSVYTRGNGEVTVENFCPIPSLLSENFWTFFSSTCF